MNCLLGRSLLSPILRLIAAMMTPAKRTAFLGWGSLIWHKDDIFDRTHGEWKLNGPSLALEFSRISQTEPRRGFLTLVIDPNNGTLTNVAYCLSTRTTVAEAVNDLQERERMPSERNVGCIDLDTGLSRCRHQQTAESIAAWAGEAKVRAVVWTDLASNFAERKRTAFSVEAAIAHLGGLDSAHKAGAVEYLRNAPSFVQTPLRSALEQRNWSV
jgi:hypothetical protein